MYSLLTDEARLLLSGY